MAYRAISQLIGRIRIGGACLRPWRGFLRPGYYALYRLRSLEGAPSDGRVSRFVIASSQRGNTSKDWQKSATSPTSERSSFWNTSASARKIHRPTRLCNKRWASCPSFQPGCGDMAGLRSPMAEAKPRRNQPPLGLYCPSARRSGLVHMHCQSRHGRKRGRRRRGNR